MMECKKALVEAEGDVEKAEDLLRMRYKGKMEKRTDRAAGEGRIAIKVEGDRRRSSSSRPRRTSPPRTRTSSPVRTVRSTTWPLAGGLR
jgi:hypothetical protein